MTRIRQAPYGSWASPISAARVAGGSIGLSEVVVAGEAVYWSEARPGEQGRVVVVRRDRAGRRTEITPADYSVLSRVHEYGGGAFTVHDGAVLFVNLADQQIYRQRPGEAPQPLTAAPGCRFADLQVDPLRNRLLCVCEDHSATGEPVNTLVAVDLAAGGVVTLASGADFYAAPALSPDGRWLAWLSWNHPAMPWDSTELWLAPLADQGRPRPPERIAGGPDESVLQPRWGGDGTLYFVCDRSGWWNLYRWHGQRVEPLCPQPAEFGTPPWVFGQSSYVPAAAGTLYCGYCRDGLWQLARLHRDGRLEDIASPYSQIDGLQLAGDRVLFRGGAPDRPTALVVYDPRAGRFDELCTATTLDFDPAFIARPEPLRFASGDGAWAHGFYYPPTNPVFTAAADEKPPLLVIGHGGPTSATSTALNLQIQFWTSRGFAVVDVDYRGSTGYGRAYHQALDGGWGVVDVADCVAAASHLIGQGRVDGTRCAIRGKSAGGYSTLAALVFHDLFRAGASYYGISDLETLAADTHKFESRYLDRLIGPYPEARARYQARSPIHHLEGLRAPVIFFQGLEDKVVPPAQAECMVAALRARGLPVAYVTFANERHGFRQAANIERALAAELYFYGRVFGFTPAAAIEPVAIDNL